MSACQHVSSRSARETRKPLDPAHHNARAPVVSAAIGVLRCAVHSLRPFLLGRGVRLDGRERMLAARLLVRSLSAMQVADGEIVKAPPPRFFLERVGLG